ncbi:MAG TPA: CPBP family intramembrane glutamic endopeptidase [Ktedonobacterales bacterium]|nr:CPBP family intramembrane glutamic endopeptidase [Ktedonobacterales bacterium]
MSDEQRAAATQPEGAGAEPPFAPPDAPDASTAALAVPWTTRQAITGAALTLVPLVLIEVLGALAAPHTATPTRRLTTQQDVSVAIVTVLAQLVVEGVFLLAPWYYLRKCLPRGRTLGLALRTLGFRRFDLGRATSAFILGLVAVFAFNAFYGIFGLRTNADALVEQATRAPISTLATLVMAVTIVPICEETFFRGYLFPGLARGMSLWVAVVTSALIFGAAHADAASFAPLAVIGAALALLRWRTGSLWPGILFHAAINSSVLIYVIGLLAHH